MRKPDDPFRVLIDGLLFAGFSSFLLALVIVLAEAIKAVL